MMAMTKLMGTSLRLRTNVSVVVRYLFVVLGAVMPPDDEGRCRVVE